MRGHQADASGNALVLTCDRAAPNLYQLLTALLEAEPSKGCPNGSLFL